MKLRLHYGFPMVSKDGESPEKPRQKGLAIIICLMAIMLMLSLVGDLIVSSAVNVELALATRDRVRAEYMAKSGLNLGLFLISVGWGIDLYRAQPGMQPPVAKPLSDSEQSMWTMLNGLPPIGASTVSLIKATTEREEQDPFGLRGAFSGKISEQMELFEDDFSIKISDESNKININDCRKGRCQHVINMLKALFSCPAEQKFLDSKRLNPEELAYRIKDFINASRGTSPESGFGDKNSPYEREEPPYKVKSAPFDSLDELKLVAGWDEEVHRVFSPYLTVFPVTAGVKETKLNLNTVPRELMGCLVEESRDSACAESFAVNYAKNIKDKTELASDQGSVKGALERLACYDGSGSGKSKKALAENWFGPASSALRVEITANTGRQERKLIAVLRRIMPKDKKGLRSKQKFKRSYEILFYKLL